MPTQAHTASNIQYMHTETELQYILYERAVYFFILSFSSARTATVLQTTGFTRVHNHEVELLRGEVKLRTSVSRNPVPLAVPNPYNDREY